MSKAIEKAVEYQIKTYGPNVMGGASMLSEEEYMRFNMNLDFKNGYELAEKDTIERAIKWLKEHWREYVWTTDNNIPHFGHWERDFRKAMEEEL